MKTPRCSVVTSTACFVALFPFIELSLSSFLRERPVAQRVFGAALSNVQSHPFRHCAPRRVRHGWRVTSTRDAEFRDFPLGRHVPGSGTNPEERSIFEAKTRPGRIAVQPAIDLPQFVARARAKSPCVHHVSHRLPERANPRSDQGQPESCEPPWPTLLPMTGLSTGSIVAPSRWHASTLSPILERPAMFDGLDVEDVCELLDDLESRCRL